MRKPLMAIAIVACLIMSVVGGLLPILQGWIFFVIALYLLATEFESGRRWVKAAPPPLALAQPLDRAGARPSLGAEPSQGIRGSHRSEAVNSCWSAPLQSRSYSSERGPPGPLMIMMRDLEVRAPDMSARSRFRDLQWRALQRRRPPALRQLRHRARQQVAEPGAAAAAVGGEAPIGVDVELLARIGDLDDAQRARRGPGRAPPCAAPGRRSRTGRRSRPAPGSWERCRPARPRAARSGWIWICTSCGTCRPRRKATYRIAWNCAGVSRAGTARLAAEATHTISSRHNGSEPTRLPRVWPKARGPIMKSTSARSSALRVGSQVNSSTTCGASRAQMPVSTGARSWAT